MAGSSICLLAALTTCCLIFIGNCQLIPLLTHEGELLEDEFKRFRSSADDVRALANEVNAMKRKQAEILARLDACNCPQAAATTPSPSPSPASLPTTGDDYEVVTFRPVVTTTLTPANTAQTQTTEPDNDITMPTTTPPPPPPTTTTTIEEESTTVGSPSGSGNYPTLPVEDVITTPTSTSTRPSRSTMTSRTTRTTTTQRTRPTIVPKDIEYPDYFDEATTLQPQTTKTPKIPKSTTQIATSPPTTPDDYYEPVTFRPPVVTTTLTPAELTTAQSGDDDDDDDDDDDVDTTASTITTETILPRSTVITTPPNNNDNDDNDDDDTTSAFTTPTGTSSAAPQVTSTYSPPAVEEPCEPGVIKSCQGHNSLWRRIKRRLRTASQNGDVESLSHIRNQLRAVNATCLLYLHVDKSDDTDAYAAIHWAARRGHVDAARLILDSVANSPNMLELKTARLGRTPYMIAAIADSTPVMATLLERGADFDAKSSCRNDSHRSAIHLAAGRGSLQAIEFLLEHSQGGERIVNVRDGRGRTPFMRAAGSGQVEVMRLLNNYGADTAAVSNSNNDFALSAIHLATGVGGINATQFILDNPPQGRDEAFLLNVRDKLGRTAFLLAAAVGRDDIMRLLLSRGAEFNAISNDLDFNSMAIHLAAEFGGQDAVNFLLNEGNGGDALLELADKLGRTPLLKAAGAGRVDILSLLLDRGADINAESNDTLTGKSAAIHLAVGGSASAVKFLLDYPSGGTRLLELRNGLGQTPLLRAASICADIEVFRVLVRKGGDLTAQDNEGQSIAQLLAKNCLQNDTIRRIVQFVEQSRSSRTQ